MKLKKTLIISILLLMAMGLLACTGSSSSGGRVHEIYISAINEQHAGFTMILQALTTQDGNEVAKANEKLTLARKQMRDYLEEINELADRNNVEIGQ